MNLKCFCRDYKHWGVVPVAWEGGTGATEKGAEGRRLGGGARSGAVSAGEGDNAGSNGPRCRGPFSSRMLVFRHSEPPPPAVRRRPRTLTCKDLDSVLPLLTILSFYLLFRGTGCFLPPLNIGMCWDIICH